jgi:general secretion pathway protein L
MLLEREVTLPAATERDLDRVLGYEMDRFTPFAAGDVYWACGPVTRDRARSRISFRLSVVPKLAIAPVVEALRSAGRAPAALLVAMDGALRRLSLNPEGPVLTRHGPVAVAACACVLLAVVAAALPIVMEARALSALEARIERGRPALAEVEGLRRRIAASTAGADALLGEEARLGCVLCTVALLTDLLPDDAYLTALTLRQRQVTLSGQAGDAARLIPRLSASAAVSEVAFLSPVTRSGQGRGEQFSLRLTMAP